MIACSIVAYSWHSDSWSTGSNNGEKRHPMVGGGDISVAMFNEEGAALGRRKSFLFLLAFVPPP